MKTKWRTDFLPVCFARTLKVTLPPGPMNSGLIFWFLGNLQNPFVAVTIRKLLSILEEFRFIFGSKEITNRENKRCQ